MKIHGAITINGRVYSGGDDVPWYVVYPFFLLHMLVFGASGFAMAYAAKTPSIIFLYLHGGLAITVYTVLYFTIFGRDEVKWMFINAALGVFGIYSQVGWLLSLFGKRIGDYPFQIHVIPFLYFVLYTFLIRHAFLDFMDARNDEQKKSYVNSIYIVVSIAISLIFFLLDYWR